MTEDLATAYDKRVMKGAAQDFLRQVGHTEGGAPITDRQLAAMTGDLETLLDLDPSDRLLDLCCGNGAVTVRLAPRVAACTGLDLSGHLIDVARKYNAPVNTTYQQADLKRLAQVPPLEPEPFSKVLMHAALQHFRPADLEPLLRAILARCGPDPVIVFGFVPEHGKQKALFSTLRKRLYRTYLQVTGQDVFGHWWSRRDLETVADKLGLSCSFHPVDASLAAAAYRFNVRMSVASRPKG